MDVEVRSTLDGVLAQEKEPNRGERQREGIDVAAVDLALDDVLVCVAGGHALGGVERGQALVNPVEEVAGAHARVEDA